MCYMLSKWELMMGAEIHLLPLVPDVLLNHTDNQLCRRGGYGNSNGTQAAAAAVAVATC
jgi:hypothetical protein